MKKISNYIHCLSFLDASLRNEAIDSLLELLEKSGKIPDKAAFRKAIFDREDLISTGIGMGVAVPHAKLKVFNDFFIAVGIQQKRGIEWDAIDKAPVRLIFLIGGPDNRQGEYLQILSQLTHAIKDQDLRKIIMQASSLEEAREAFSSF